MSYVLLDGLYLDEGCSRRARGHPTHARVLLVEETLGGARVGVGGGRGCEDKVPVRQAGRVHEYGVRGVDMGSTSHTSRAHTSTQVNCCPLAPDICSLQELICDSNTRLMEHSRCTVRKNAKTSCDPERIPPRQAAHTSTLIMPQDGVVSKGF